MKVQNALQQARTVTQTATTLTSEDKIKDLAKIKAAVQREPMSSKQQVIVLAGMEHLNTDRLTIYEHVRQGAETIFRPVIYGEDRVPGKLIEFSMTQVLTLFQRLLRLPFGNRLVSAISKYGLVEAQEFYTKAND